MQVKPSQAASMVTAYIKAKIVPMLTGSPGIGKSAIIHQIALQYGLKVIDLRLSQCDPTDLLGFPSITGGRAGYVPMETFPIEGDRLPEGYNGWLLFLDEFNSASTAVQAAAYKVVLDRMIGIHRLHPNVATVCAGNLATDGAIVNEMSTALQSRLAHLELVVDPNEWCDWAMANGVDHRITDHIKFKPSNLYTFSPDHTDATYACPRTWEFENRLMPLFDDGSKDFLPVSAGVLSEGVAREFNTHLKIYDSLPKPEFIASNPEKAMVPSEPSIMYAVTGSVANHLSSDNAGQMMKYVKRLPKEFQVVTLRESVRRNKDMLAHPVMRDWISTSAVELF
jgi:hypothetical protein